MDDWQDWRKQRREELLALRESVPETERLCWSTAITRLLREGFPMGKHRVVGGYWPHRGEYDPRPAMEHFRAGGTILALPEVVRKGGALRFREWRASAAMKPGAYGIPVPDDAEAVEVDALLLPMVGFDRLGFRLGYGGGYFDRTLAASAVAGRRPLAIGVAFEIQKLDSVHPQSHDIAMDYVVTEAGIRQVTPEGLVALAAADCARGQAAR
ncbi:5-formyltetrahydrofolate cyclo-ligase [Nitrosovibrio sp. Nv17]|jgi:5,10-methenyltetrahydrofolate synthetase|uniref:5-formyltetrahydrofolate cyclo-ligase n=1 Tax=Nitrosovibrio sp. Nv17 TaxID=1855339 RepID=UPI000908A705|nr:5-formyltetrahydrofolate cyclo-ligase [Nitrosovibrio sp. Nv17]SFW23599.1 5,10-methenyltetrahydrofolate synthetase [Nitrosovibrio sp. Nv17]